MVNNSAGMRCPDCAFSGAVAMPVSPVVLGLAVLAAALTGLAGAYLLAFIACGVPYATFLAAPLYGRAVADAISTIAERKCGTDLQAIGIGSILFGTIVAFNSPVGAMRVFHANLPEAAQSMVGLSIGIAIAICAHRLRTAPQPK
jgi:hypothetical protein